MPQCRQEEKKYCIYTIWPCPNARTLAPRVMNIYNFGRLFLGYHYYTLSLSDLCLGVEKKILKKIINFHYMTYLATPQHKKPCPGGHGIYNFGRPFLAHFYYILSLSEPCPGVEKKIFEEIQLFYPFCPKITSPLAVGGGGDS